MILDKTDVVRELLAEAAWWTRRPFKMRGRAWCEQRKDAIWDYVDTLRDLRARGASTFSLAYFATVKMILTTYAQFVRAELPASGKVDRFRMNAAFRAKYRMPPLPDSTFVEVRLPCLASESLQHIERAANYVQRAMGGFDIDGWSLRSPLELGPE